MKSSSIFIAFSRSEKIIGKWLMIGEINDWAIIPYWEEHEQCKALVNKFGLFQAQSMSLGGAVAAVGKFCIVHPHLSLEAVVLAFKLTQSCLGKIWKSNLDLSSNDPVFHLFNELEKNEKSR